MSAIRHRIVARAAKYRTRLGFGLPSGLEQQPVLASEAPQAPPHDQ
jgi:hypothetical protein